MRCPSGQVLTSTLQHPVMVPPACHGKPHSHLVFLFWIVASTPLAAGEFTCIVMHPLHLNTSYPTQATPDHETRPRNETSHRGPLSRTWPQLFKKRRRYSPVRESAQQQAQQQHRPESPLQIQAPRKKSPIPRRSNTIAPAHMMPAGAGGVATPQAHLLASKSNYELISSGEHLDMGLHFSTAMATGVTMKRATHRAAEQARRDRMKTAMMHLAEFLLHGQVTFGSGTTCFVVMRGSDGRDAASSRYRTSRETGEKRTTVHKARLIEMALEKMRAQETEMDVLRREIEHLRAALALAEEMDVT
ncbi:hypothetical protein ACEQ8H_000498 [Pleosporales sp. CAS-2024a]